MIIKLIDFGGKIPERAHYNDAGADVFAKSRVVLWPETITKVPLGVGLNLPDGVAAFVLPRSGLSSKGITAEVVPIDSGYRGEIHAIMYNSTQTKYIIEEGDRIAQLVIMPVIISEFSTGGSSEELKERGTGGFGSTGYK